MRTTEYLKLNLQEDSDFYDIEALNSIFTALENEAKRLKEKDDATDNKLKQNTPAEAKQIPDSTNLNTLIDGFYYSGNSAQVATYVNCPVSHEFSLIQIRSNQLLYGAGSMHYRLKTNAKWLRVATNEDISTVNTEIGKKVDKINGKGLSDQNFTLAEKNKLKDIETNANRYSHPPTHSADMITETIDRKIMTATERLKLEGIESGATKYKHPDKHPATIITQDANNRFVSDTEKEKWNKGLEQIRIVEGLETPLSAYVSNTGDFSYRCFVSIPGVRATDSVDVNFILGSSVRAQECGVSGVTIAKADGVEIYSDKIPSTALVFDAVIKRGGK